MEKTLFVPESAIFWQKIVRNYPHTYLLLKGKPEENISFFTDFPTTSENEEVGNMFLIGKDHVKEVTVGSHDTLAKVVVMGVSTPHLEDFLRINIGRVSAHVRFMFWIHYPNVGKVHWNDEGTKKRIPNEISKNLTADIVIEPEELAPDQVKLVFSKQICLGHGISMPKTNIFSSRNLSYQGSIFVQY
jgi:hypothetical protein